MKKPVLRQLEDHLVKVIGRNAERVRQGGLDGAGYPGNPVLVVTAFDNVDFDKRHCTLLVRSCVSLQGFDRQGDASGLRRSWPNILSMCILTYCALNECAI
jgi:hypothetical protein